MPAPSHRGTGEFPPRQHKTAEAQTRNGPDRRLLGGASLAPAQTIRREGQALFLP